MKRKLLLGSFLLLSMTSLIAEKSDVGKEALALLLNMVGEQASYSKLPLGIVQAGDSYYFKHSRERMGENITEFCTVLKDVGLEKLYVTLIVSKEKLETVFPSVARQFLSLISPLSTKERIIMGKFFVVQDLLRLLRGEDLSLKYEPSHIRDWGVFNDNCDVVTAIFEED